jgi:energy-coupling factor transport system permease protein
VSAALDRWNPLTPLAAALLLVTIAYAGAQPVAAIIALAIALALAWTSGVGRGVTVLAVAVGFPTFLLLFVMNGVVAIESEDVIRLGALRVAPDAAREAAQISLRLSAAVASLGWLITGVAHRRLTQALAQRGLPAWAVYVVVASLEAVPQARRRAQEVLDAQRCRGLSVSGGVLRRARVLTSLAGPLLVSMVTESEERALALDARGFVANRRRGALTPITDHPGERAFRSIVWLSLAAVVIWKLAR